VKVEGTQFLTHGRSSVEIINGDFIDVGRSMCRAIAGDEALKRAMVALNATKYAWQDTALQAVGNV